MRKNWLQEWEDKQDELYETRLKFLRNAANLKQEQKLSDILKDSTPYQYYKTKDNQYSFFKPEKKIRKAPVKKVLKEESGAEIENYTIFDIEQGI